MVSLGNLGVADCIIEATAEFLVEVTRHSELLLAHPEVVTKGTSTEKERLTKEGGPEHLPSQTFPIFGRDRSTSRIPH